MTDTLSSAAPSWSRRVWADSQSIYLEIPATNGGPPFIQRYSRAEGGLSQALALISLAYEAQAPKGIYPTTPHPLINRGRRILNYSEESREAARGVLKKLKLI